MAAAFDFKRVLRRGRRITSPRFLICIELAPEGLAASGAGFGVSIPKRVAKSAVLRNAIKRQAREAFRHSSVFGAHLVVLGRVSFQTKRPAIASLKKSVREELDTLLARAAKKT